MVNVIFLSQIEYCKEILNKVDMENCKDVVTPMSTSCYMDVNTVEKIVGQTKFKGLIGLFLYLTASILKLCLLCACVPNFNLIPKNLTSQRLKGS